MSTTQAWDEKRAAFFAGNPKCTVCGGGFDHYSRTGICRKCQIIKYRVAARAKEPEYRRRYVKKHKKKIKAYQAKYYLANKAAISECKKVKYHERKQLTASYI